jgi:hypothetical protein
MAVSGGGRDTPIMSLKSWRLWRRPPVDDAYTDWLDAHSRCTDALAAWRRAEPRARRAAYRAYVEALEQEERAAAELERLQPPPLAA